MRGYRLSDQKAPPTEPDGPGYVRRPDGIRHLDPALMHDEVTPQNLPAWDLARIVGSRAELLRSMHQHWATSTLSAQELLAEVEQGRRLDEQAAEPTDRP